MHLGVDNCGGLASNSLISDLPYIPVFVAQNSVATELLHTQEAFREIGGRAEGLAQFDADSPCCKTHAWIGLE